MTLIELLVVLSVVAVLASISGPPVLRAVNRSTASVQGEEVMGLIQEAQRRARTGTAPSPAIDAPHWGVAFVQEGGTAYAVLLYGHEATHEWTVDGTIVRRVALPQVEIRTAAGAATPTALSGRVAWFFSYLTARPIRTPDQRLPIDIGIPSSPVVGAIQFHRQRGGPAMALMWYRIGLGAVQTIGGA